MQKVQILGVSSYLPETVMKSDDLFDYIKSEQYGLPINWMSEKMGIMQRRLSSESDQPSTLAIPAAEDALKESGIKPEKVGLVIFCGIEKDFSEPATAHNIQHALGLNAKFAFDISNACFGFVDSIKVATNFILQGDIEYALICTGEVPSKILRVAADALRKGLPLKRARNVLGALTVGDAGGAIIVGKSRNNKSGFELFNYISDSKHTKKCIYKIGDDGLPEGQMLMGPITNTILKAHENMIGDTFTKLKWNKFDWMLSHQMGQKPFDRISEMKGVSKNKMIKTFDLLGNITSATFPVNFEKLSKNAKVKSGDHIGACFAGSGVAIGQIGYTF